MAFSIAPRRRGGNHGHRGFAMPRPSFGVKLIEPNPPPDSMTRSCISLFGLLTVLSFAGSEPVSSPNTPVSFLRDLAPLLRENCLACHNAQKHKSNFRMTSYKSI